MKYFKKMPLFTHINCTTHQEPDKRTSHIGNNIEIFALNQSITIKHITDSINKIL